MNSFFSNMNKKKQEQSSILDTFQFNYLLTNTVFILPLSKPSETNISNKIFIDFLNFKKFVTNENFDYVVTYFISLIVEILQIYETFELHVNLNSFTISACEKYKDIVLLFYEKFQVNYINRIDSLYVYNTPHIFETIRTIFTKLSPLSSTFMIEPVLYDKKESPAKMADILKDHMNMYNEYGNDNEEEDI